jgi:hypothetical protein
LLLELYGKHAPILSIFDVKPIGEGENVQLSNGQLSANFDPKTGYLKVTITFLKCIILLYISQ